MKINNRKFIRLAIATALAVGTCQIASAIGLGPISVHSHIGEPLKASIKVNGLSASDAANTRINIADISAYQRRGITKLPSHDSLRFGLSPVGNAYIITVSSSQQIREPFINFILSIKSGGEEIVREYAVFLEPAAGGLIPPVIVEASSEPPAIPVSSGPKLLEIKPASSTSVGWQGNHQPKVTQVQHRSQAPVTTVTRAAVPVAQSAPPPIPKGPQAPWTGQTYGPVQPGETLYSIANMVRPEGYSIQSVMRQIYHANRSAFSSRSLSSLMAGYTLKIPDFQHGAVAAPEPPKPKRKVSYKPAVVKKAKATGVAAQIADNTQQSQVEGSDGTEQDSDATVAQPQVTTTETVVAEESVQPSLLNNNGGEVEVVVDEQPANDDATTIPKDNEQAADNGDGDMVGEDNVIPSMDEVTADAEAVDEVVVETPVVEDTVESIMPPVDEQPVLIEENSAENNQVAAEASPAQVVPTNVAPVAPPVVEEEDKGFLFTTYAILPMWQWLIIAVVTLAVIALLLFRVRRKSVVDDHGIAEDDGLNADEMEAVLAKINAMDDNDDIANTPTQHHAEEDDWDVESFVDHTDDANDAFTQEMQHEPSHHAEVSLNKEVHQDTEFSDDAADFLFDDELPTDNQQAVSQAVEEDFFADDSMDWNDFDATDTEIPVESTPPVAENPAPEEAKPTSNSSNDMDWLDELVFDGEERPTRKAKPAATSPSNDEMEINLDLASSFIATGHGERAISWLEEVIEMGNAEQKTRAQELLDKIRGD